MKCVGIIFAMKEELDELLRNIKIDKEYSIFDLTFYEAMIGNVKCVMLESGIGKVNAARSCQILIDNIGVDYIFNVGVAGGVSNSLKIGDIVIGNELVQHDFDITAFNHEKGYIPNVGTYIKCDDYLMDVTKRVLDKENIKISSGVIASGDIFCTEYNMAKKINNKFNALCVEMEGASIAQVCYLSHIPFIVLRSISDAPKDNNVVDYEAFLKDSSEKIAKVLYGVVKKLDEELK